MSDEQHDLAPIDRAPKDMPAEYIAQLTHELYARTGMYSNSRSLHERAMEVKAEVTRRLVQLEQMQPALKQAREALSNCRSAIDPIINPNVTALRVDGVLDMINAAGKATEALAALERLMGGSK